MADSPLVPAQATRRRIPYPEEVTHLAFEAYVRLDGNKSLVAQEIGVSRDAIELWERRDDWKGRVKRAEDELTESAHRRVVRELLDCTPDAVATLKASLTALDKEGNPNHAIRVKAANSILDRTGHPAIQRMILDQRTASLNLHATLDPDAPKPTTEEATAILIRMMSDETSSR